jgi:hypothetical protein
MSHIKPSIVFAHGIWADGSCFSKLIPTLQAEGHEVVASQHSLDTLEVTSAAKRMGAKTYEVDSSHVVMLSNPGLALDVIRAAANGV